MAVPVTTVDPDADTGVTANGSVRGNVYSAPDGAPIVVVGMGPVGVRLAQELHRLYPNAPLVLYGNEPWEPYNRVRLSSFLAGESDWAGLTRGLELPVASGIQVRLHCAVVSIDRENHCVRDAAGRVQDYSRLVLATGSRPRIPDIPGIGQANIYVFRDFDDVQRLFARRVHSRRTVVLGGGLLGLEAARAMQRFNTEVVVIEHTPRLMMAQLDEDGAARLAAHVESSGIRLMLGQGVKAIHGEGRVTGLSLRSGERIECDTVIVAAGIVPNIDLALQSGLLVGRGIRVNDAMQTSDPDILAVGECAEHRGMVYGIVAPGLEQAGVAAHSVAGGTAHYTGSLVATRLKVLDLPVFSMGRIERIEGGDVAQVAVWQDGDSYRKVLVRRNRLVGALAVGPCADMSRLQEAIDQRRLIYPWQLVRFRMTGSLWDEEAAAKVMFWPAGAIVCNCNGVTRGQLGAALESGCKSVADLAACTRASTVCGSCKPLLADLLGGNVRPEPVRAWKVLGIAALMSLMLALALILLPGIPYAGTVQLDWKWDELWRDSLFKQISGFSLLGLTAVGLLLTLRKRWPRIRFADFAYWRLVHVVLGLLVLGGLYVHTGGRMGNELDFLLVACFAGLMLAGAVTAGVIAFEHRLSPVLVKRWREKSFWIHILLFWPVPVLLGFHVLKTYYF